MFKSNTGELKTMHYCEAPGNFILALNHYLFTKTNVKKFTWNAQTLNPKDKSVAIGDDYKIIKNNKSKWDFGPDDTGDILNVKNIKYYKKKYNDVDLVTGDC